MRRYIYIYTALLLLQVHSSCHRHYYIQQRESRIHTIMSASGADSSFTKFLGSYKMRMDSVMNIVIGRTDTILYKAQPECTLGNFEADAMYVFALQLGYKVDAAIFNYGGIRLPSLASGNITIGKVYELLPFDNTLTIIDVPGDSIQRFCNHMAAAKGWPVSHISYAINNKMAKDILIDGQQIDIKKTYHIATNDYLANGGDNCSFLIPLKRESTGILIRDILINYIRELTKQNKPLHPYIEKRVRNAE